MPARYADASNKVFHTRVTVSYTHSREPAEQTTANAEIRDYNNFFEMASWELGK